MYIIFDSNIWLSELGLNTAKGNAAKFFVKTKGAIIAVPEVIKLETERNLKNELKRQCTQIEKMHRQLLAVFGKLKELVLPDEKEIEKKVESVFNQPQLEILELPFTIESAKSSFLKTIDKTPPSDKDQQFKDGVIWADCLGLLKKDNVFLVTSDKAFYQDRKYEKGLANILASEIKNFDNSLKIFPNIKALIEEIKVSVDIDENELVDSFKSLNQESIDRLLSHNGFSLFGDPVVIKGLYATEDPNKLFLEFEITYECEDLTSQARMNPKLILRGDGTYLLDKKEFSELRNFGEELIFKTGEGEEKSLRNIVIFAASLAIGLKTIEHSIKYKIN